MASVGGAGRGRRLTGRECHRRRADRGEPGLGAAAGLWGIAAKIDPTQVNRLQL